MFRFVRSPRALFTDAFCSVVVAVDLSPVADAMFLKLPVALVQEVGPALYVALIPSTVLVAPVRTDQPVGSAPALKSST